MLANRVSAVFFFLFSLAMLFYLIPSQIESVDYGWMKPATLPTIISATLGIVALGQFFFPNGMTNIDLNKVIKTFFLFSIGVFATYMMSQLGFLYIAPILSLSLMLLIGERRVIWLFGGGILVPVGIWFIVIVLLDRALF